MKSMCCDIKEFFPHISKKGLEIELYHVDELAGRVTLESDHDLVPSLPTPCESTRKSAKRKVIVTE